MTYNLQLSVQLLASVHFLIICDLTGAIAMPPQAYAISNTVIIGAVNTRRKGICIVNRELMICTSKLMMS